MIPSSPELLDLLAKKMAYLNKAVEVHAQNVANTNTPDYKPLEVAPFTFGDAMKQAGSISMAVTDSRHIVPASLAQTNDVAVRVKGHGKSSEGAGQDVEQESMKVSQVGTEYQLITSLYRKFSTFFRIALKGS